MCALGLTATQGEATRSVFDETVTRSNGRPDAALLAIHPFIQQKIFNHPYREVFGAKLTTGAGEPPHLISVHC